MHFCIWHFSPGDNMRHFTQDQTAMMQKLDIIPAMYELCYDRFEESSTARKLAGLNYSTTFNKYLTRLLVVKKFKNGMNA
jgi:hypothetical protein